MSQLELTYFEGRKLGKQQVSIIRVVFLQMWCFSQGVSHLSTSKSKMRACFSCPSVWWSGRWVRITLDSLEEIESPCNHPVRSWAGQHRLSPSPGVHFCLLYEWTGRCILIFQTCLPPVLSSFCRPVYLCTALTHPDQFYPGSMPPSVTGGPMSSGKEDIY